ncbi:MAG: cupredoxin domain-containing protein [Nitrososphaeraceae archaeon]
MGKRNKLVNQKKKNKDKNNNKNKITPKKIIVIGIVFTIISLIIYGGINSLKSSNGNFLLSPPRNFFMKATYLPNEGNVYTSQSTGTAKILNSGAGNSRSGLAIGYNPTITLNQGNSLSIHLINEDSEKHSRHNLNLDEFNIHTKNLGYFQTQTVTFTANKTGTFNYYCSIHPEMNGEIIVVANNHTR